MQQVPMSTGEFVTRVKAGAQAGRIEADLGQGAVDTVTLLDQAGLLESFDWVGAVGSEFPDIQKRVDRVMAAYRGKVLDYTHLIYIVGFRSDRLTEKDIPRKLDDLADPKFKGRVGVASSGTPFYYLAPFWGRERAIDVARK